MPLTQGLFHKVLRRIACCLMLHFHVQFGAKRRRV